MEILKDRITINGKTYFVGEIYKVRSFLDSPYLNMSPEIQEKHNINKHNIYTYIGELRQVPYFKDNILIGRELYFKVNDIDYHEDFLQAEKLELVVNGVVTIDNID